MTDTKNVVDYQMVVKISAIVFIILEALLFPIIQFTPWRVSAVASYSAIILAAVFALISMKGERGGHLIRLGIAFTLVADCFLVLLDDSELQGVIAFIAVQICYFVYLVLREGRMSVKLANLSSRVLLSAVLVVLAFIVLGKDTDALSIVSVIYYGNLVTNVIFAFLLGREERLFAIGLLLFSMCDLCIGLETLFTSYLDSDALDFFYGKYLNLPWVFYQPSQMLIALHLGEKIQERNYTQKDGE